MWRVMMTLTMSLAAASCGVQEKNHLADIGTDIDPAQRTMEVMVDFENDDNLERQFRLLSRAAGLTETLSLRLYGAIDMEGEYIEFLSTPGLKYGDIVTEGSVFKLTSMVHSENYLEFKIGDSLPGKYWGRFFEQGEKNGTLIAVSGLLGSSTEAEGNPVQSEPESEAKQLLFLCKNMAVKHPYTEDWRKIGCDLNVVNGKLQIAYNKTTANPQGTMFLFTAPKVL
jgi:hypothetical protein